jgi:hypothetical protein
MTLLNDKIARPWAKLANSDVILLPCGIHDISYNKKLYSITSVLIKFIPLPLGVDGIYNGELMKGMVITTIAACFSNSMLNSAYFTLNFWFRQLCGTFKITQLFILLSTYPACISNTIFEGKAEFELYINRITVDV